MSGRQLAGLWFGVLGPPVIWAARLMTAYALVPRSCEPGGLTAMNAVTLVALAGSLLAGFVAFRSWRGAGEAADGDGTAGLLAGRTRFLGFVGMLSSLLFSAVIVAEGLANLMVDPCVPAGAPL